MTTIQTIRDAQLDTVVGGINPQPLPPKILFSRVTNVRSFSANAFAARGIIFVGG